MAARRRKRLRAADLGSPRPSRSLPALGAVAVAVSLLFMFKTYVGDDAGELLEALGVDPLLQLPPGLSQISPAGVLAEGGLRELAEGLARAADGCLGDAQAVARIEAELTLPSEGGLVWRTGRLDPGALAPASLMDCVSRKAATLELRPPLGGPVQITLKIPVFRAHP